MNKPALLAAIRAALVEEFEHRLSASRQTRAGGNDEESRAEDKYDTLSTEQNYLADGLAKQALAAREALTAFDKLTPRDFGPADPIDLGAAIQIAFPGETTWFFLAPAGGGLEVESAHASLTLVTPESPIGSQLRHKSAGDQILHPAATILAVA